MKETKSWLMFFLKSAKFSWKTLKGEFLVEEGSYATKYGKTKLFVFWWKRWLNYWFSWKGNSFISTDAVCLYGFILPNLSKSDVIFVVCFLFVVSTSCQTYNTPFNNDGGGNFVYLDRHTVDCGQNKMLESVQLMRDRTLNNYRYKYTCCITPRQCQQETFNTNFTYDGRGNTVYLDRQNVQCPNNDYMSSFNLNRNSATGNRVRYIYKCCHLHDTSKTVYNGVTPWNSDGGGNALYLDRHRIKCNRGYGLTQFRLVRLPPLYRYEFKCAKVNM